MKKQNIIIVAVIIFLLGVVQSSDVYSQDLQGRCDDKEQNLMRTQADAFLRVMPSDLQKRQTTAIMQAIDGDNSSLMAFRNALNTRAE